MVCCPWHLLVCFAPLRHLSHPLSRPRHFLHLLVQPAVDHFHPLAVWSQSALLHFHTQLCPLIQGQHVHLLSPEVLRVRKKRQQKGSNVIKCHDQKEFCFNEHEKPKSLTLIAVFISKELNVTI